MKPIFSSFYRVFFYGLFSFAINSMWAQENRYAQPIFDDLVIERDVVYGANTTQGGVQQGLTMDIYAPANDSDQNRTLVIFAHGGYFLFGDKLEFEDECEALAKSGYVVASINYRLIDVEEVDFVSKCAVIDAVSDMKAAVRFFTKNAAGDNAYQINPHSIFIGGYSAGAVTALHYAYANTVEDVLAMGGEELLNYVVENGGLEGNSGNPGYSSAIKGVINIAGSIHHAQLLDENEPVLMSIHGTEDQIVPFNEGTTGDTEVVTQGSGLIHKRADEIGLKNYLKAIPDEGHLVRFSCGDCTEEIRRFIFENR